MIHFFDNSIVSEPGNPIHEILKPVVKKDGTIELIHDGYENTDEEIQSYEQEVNIENIVSRYMNGDLDALNKRVGQYGDFTEMPKTYAEILQKQIDARNIFDSLSPEIRSKFNNDANQFFAQSGTDEWFEKMNVFFEKEDIKNTEKEEVKAE